MNAAIEFKNVDLIFGKKKQHALELLDQNSDRESILKKTGAILGVADINLEIQKGKIFVLMGLSGSGKSCLLRCINRLNTVSRGQLLINYQGEDIDMATVSKAKLHEMRMNHIAMVFQQFGLLPWDTVQENVAFGLSIKKKPPGEIKKTVSKYLDMVELSPWADHLISELSGGMQQRVGLARALATDAEILLMDEPFSALDPLIREHLQDEMLKIQKELKKTIVFVSHDLNEALKMGDFIAIMKDGRIVQAGTADEIVFNPTNDYVKRFVSGINPLTSLYAGSLMSPLDTPPGSLLETDGLSIKLGAEGKPESCSHDGANVPIEYQIESDRENALFVVDYECWMHHLVKIIQTTPHPILVTGDGKPVGIIRKMDIFRGLTLHS